MNVAFEVEGRPVPQGSMTASYNRRTQVAHVHHVQGAALAAWRAAIRESARRAMKGEQPWHRAVAIGLEFRMSRPNSHIKLQYGRQTVRERYIAAEVTTTPDIDKLVRAALDAMTGIIYIDDSQVVSLHAEEVYALSPGLLVQAREHEWTTYTKELGQDDEAHPSEGQLDLLSLWERRGG